MQSEFPGTNTAQILIMVDRITAKTVLEEDILLMTEELVDAVSDVAGVKSVTSVLDLGSTKEGILSRPLEERVGWGPGRWTIPGSRAHLAPSGLFRG